MLNEYTLKAINKVTSKEEYEELMGRLKTSEAPLEVREEAMRELKAQHSEYDEVDKLPTKELFAELKDGEADISDMGGFGN